MVRALLTAMLAAAITLALPGVRASAAISGTATLAGPSGDVRQLGGAALAPDGTGGVAYLAIDPADGRAHVFVARFVRGTWSASQRVDAGQRFDSQWPRIAAATGGRLVVIWTQPQFQGQDTLYSATLPRGGSRFQAPTLVDYDIGTATNATFPALAMSRDGEALLAYRVITVPVGDHSVPPGYVKAELRLARYDGTRWSVMASRGNRNVNSPVAIPSAANAPRVAVDQNGNGSVLFQEPDDAFVDRLWLRRVFGGRLGVQLLASPQKVGEQAVNGGADAPALAESPLAAVAVAFRQAAGERSPLPGTRVMTNALPDGISERASVFSGPILGDGLAAAAAPANVGAPAVGIDDDGETLLAYRADGRVQVMTTDYAGRASGPQSLDAGADGPDPQATLGAGQLGAVAWRAPGGAAVQQRVGTRSAGSRLVTVPGAGAPVELALGGDGLGDALVAVRQEADGASTIAAATVDAPPQPFGLRLPVDWARGATVALQWDAAADAFGGVSYGVTVDGKTVATTAARRADLQVPLLPDGRHAIGVIATDGNGGQTASHSGRVKVDRRPPSVGVNRRRHRLVQLRMSDPGGRDVSGVKAGATTVTWGDGKRTSKRGTRAQHRYAAKLAGRRMRITIRTADRAGNRLTVARQIVVRR